MDNFLLWDGSRPAGFVVDESADSGLKKIARKVIKDYVAVTGACVSLDTDIKGHSTAVLFADSGNSSFLKQIEERGLIDLDDIRGKREVFKFACVEFEGVHVLVIAGSDKLGSIYGMFRLSELMGVSPLVYWADAVINKQIRIELRDVAYTSKEPSVKFRGFFINDEWPCYGNWTMEHFGGFNAEMYDHVFELLLRLKGNYLWPAMWSSSFAWDGPGLKSYELATEYGIYIGNSHHEPCLRAGEEYRHVRGPESIYGDAWSFIDNPEGITRFWKDSLDERGGFNSVVTVGMRGEADSKILGENATLADNINLLKDVITCQKKLLAETEAKFNKKFPKMLALYKEVEPFYYGAEGVPGLIDWDGIEDVTLMLCEDNHGYVRTLPGDRNRNHPGGFGMYYHVDYHGDPISSEWINSSPIVTMWEQMLQTYDYGVRDIWILNVGDLKHNEFPLSFFLNMAYDIEKYRDNRAAQYTLETVASVLGVAADSDTAREASDILTETVRINGMRRPEALNSGIYAPAVFNEARRMLDRVAALEDKESRFFAKLNPAQQTAWYSLSGFQTRATVNLLRMHLYAGINNHYASLGLKAANIFGDKVTNAIGRDRALKRDWAGFNGNKWKGMELASHIGFVKWNDDGCRYPVRCRIEPLDGPHMVVKRRDGERIYDKKYGPPMELVIDDFLYEGQTEAVIEIHNTGEGSLNFKIEFPETAWLSFSAKEGLVGECETVTLTCDRSKLTSEEQCVSGRIFDGDTPVILTVKARGFDRSLLEKGVETALEGPCGYSIPADAFYDKDSRVKVLEDYGFYGTGLKAEFEKEGYVSYRLYSDSDREVTAECVFAPSAPLFNDGKLAYTISVNDGGEDRVNTVPNGYRPGEVSDRTWALGALNHRRSAMSQIHLKRGVNTVKIGLKDPGLVLLKLFVYDKPAPVSYMGPMDSVIAE